MNRRQESPNRTREPFQGREEGRRATSGRGSASALDSLRKQEVANERLRPKPERSADVPA